VPIPRRLGLRRRLLGLLLGYFPEERKLRRRLAGEFDPTTRALQRLQPLAQQPRAGKIERLQRLSVDDDTTRPFLRQLRQGGLDGDDVLDAPRAVEAYRQRVTGPGLFEQLASHRAEISIPSCAAAHAARTLSSWRKPRTFLFFRSC
jgi:hypothetical protein